MMFAQNVTVRKMMKHSKWANWYDNQNDATKVWLDTQAKEDNKLIFLGMLPGFFLGVIVTTLLLL